MADEALLADLLASLGAIGRSMQDRFDPRRFLGPFSERIQRLIPHDRLVLQYLEDDGRTFTVFTEHAPPELALHERHYTTEFDPRGRFVIAEWGIRPAFAGESMRVDDVGTDVRWAAANPFEQRVFEAGIRSLLAVPLRGADRIVGALVATSLEVGRCTDEQLALLGRVADLISPFIQSEVLLHRERRRRRRLAGLDGLTGALAGSLNVRAIFDRLAEAVRPVLDFDHMGVALLSESGRDVEILAEFDESPTHDGPARIPLDAFSFAEQVRAGEPVLVHDARIELDPARPGDRQIIDGGGRSVLSVPLRFGARGPARAGGPGSRVEPGARAGETPLRERAGDLPGRPRRAAPAVRRRAHPRRHPAHPARRARPGVQGARWGLAPPARRP